MSSPGLPRPLRAFIALFNREEYWESHEALEDAWRETGSDFYQGLIIYASAFVHAERENPHGVRAQLEKAERYLAPYRPAHLGIDVDALFRHAARCRRALREDSPVPRIRLDPDPALVDGGEPELA